MNDVALVLDRDFCNGLQHCRGSASSVKVMKFLVQIFAPFLCRNQRHNIYGADCNLQSNAPAVLRRPTSKSSYLKYEAIQWFSCMFNLH